MMGTKTLGEIRADLEEALARTTDNPIQWLEQRIRELKQKNKGKSNPTTVLESLLNVLKRGKKKNPAKRTMTRTRS